MIDRKQIKNAVTFFALSFLFVISILAICMALATWVFSYKPSATDHDEAYAVSAGIHYPFKPYDKESPHHPPSIYVKPGVNRTVLNIYGVLDKHEQEAILHQLVSAKQLVPDKPMRVIFMEKEVWTQVTESLSTRGREKVIRIENIE